uniref:Ribosomal protein S3 n=1 Tax=Botryococcus braunii Showa TaxID=1202541 RepID=A0A162NQV8_BOTBR|nr:ribosomal protein S3 [Botryococcus braunii Showa]
MGQKANPIGLRLKKTNKNYNSLWFSDLFYGECLEQDLGVNNYLKKIFKQIGYPGGEVGFVPLPKMGKILFPYLLPEVSRVGRSSRFRLKINKSSTIHRKKLSPFFGGPLERGVFPALFETTQPKIPFRSNNIGFTHNPDPRRGLLKLPGAAKAAASDPLFTLIPSLPSRGTPPPNLPLNPLIPVPLDTLNPQGVRGQGKEGVSALPFTGPYGYHPSATVGTTPSPFWKTALTPAGGIQGVTVNSDPKGYRPTWPVPLAGGGGLKGGKELLVKEKNFPLEAPISIQNKKKDLVSKKEFYDLARKEGWFWEINFSSQGAKDSQKENSGVYLPYQFMLKGQNSSFSPLLVQSNPWKKRTTLVPSDPKLANPQGVTGIAEGQGGRYPLRGCPPYPELPSTRTPCGFVAKQERASTPNPEPVPLTGSGYQGVAVARVAKQERVSTPEGLGVEPDFEGVRWAPYTPKILPKSWEGEDGDPTPPWWKRFLFQKSLLFFCTQKWRRTERSALAEGRAGTLTPDASSGLTHACASQPELGRGRGLRKACTSTSGYPLQGCPPYPLKWGNRFSWRKPPVSGKAHLHYQPTLYRDEWGEIISLERGEESIFRLHLCQLGEWSTLFTQKDFQFTRPLASTPVEDNSFSSPYPLIPSLGVRVKRGSGELSRTPLGLGQGGHPKRGYQEVTASAAPFSKAPTFYNSTPPFFSTIESSYRRVSPGFLFIEFWRLFWDGGAAFFVAEEIKYYITRRVPFPRIKNQLLREIIENRGRVWESIGGIRICCSGRTGGRSKKAQRSKKEEFQWGRSSLNLFSSRVAFARSTALTMLGVVGIKVWICYK